MTAVTCIATGDLPASVCITSTVQAIEPSLKAPRLRRAERKPNVGGRHVISAIGTGYALLAATITAVVKRFPLSGQGSGDALVSIDAGSCARATPRVDS